MWMIPSLNFQVDNKLKDVLEENIGVLAVFRVFSI